MSLILDALNRSEGETAGKLSNLHSAQIATDQQAAGRRSGYRWSFALLLICASAGLLWLLYPATVQLAAPRPPVAVVPEPTVMPIPEKFTDPAAPDHSLPTKPMVSVGSKSTANTMAVAALYERDRVVSARPAPTTVLPEPADEQTPSTSALADIESMVNMAAAVMATAGVPEHPAPFLSDLSQQAKDSIPSIFYTGHAYGTAVEEAYVTFNGQVFRAGEQVLPGLAVVEIFPEFVVLNFRGTEFRLASLSSWVNL